MMEIRMWIMTVAMIVFCALIYYLFFIADDGLPPRK